MKNTNTANAENKNGEQVKEVFTGEISFAQWGRNEFTQLVLVNGERKATLEMGWCKDLAEAKALMSLFLNSQSMYRALQEIIELSSEWDSPSHNAITEKAKAILNSI